LDEDNYAKDGGFLQNNSDSKMIEKYHFPFPNQRPNEEII